MSEAKQPLAKEQLDVDLQVAAKEKEEVKVPEPIVITKIVEKEPIIQKVEVQVLSEESLKILAALFKIG